MVESQQWRETQREQGLSDGESREPAAKRQKTHHEEGETAPAAVDEAALAAVSVVVPLIEDEKRDVTEAAPAAVDASAPVIPMIPAEVQAGEAPAAPPVQYPVTEARGC